MKKLALALSLPALCLSITAHAHFNLDAPLPNTTATDGGMSSPPCGVGTASGVVTPAQGGHTISLQIDEYVPHTGFYRIALAMNSVSELPLDPVVKNAAGDILPPSGKPSGTSSTAAFEDPAVFPVLQGHLFVHTGTAAQMFQMDLMLPNITCAKCTLQVVEFMSGHGFNGPTPPDTGPGGGYFYRHCADLKITADPSLPAFNVGGAGGSSAGGATSTAGGSGGDVNAAGGAGGLTIAGGAGGVSQASSGAAAVAAAGASVSGTGGAGGASAAVGGASAAVGGANGAGGGASGAGAATSADSGGCSCSLGKESSVSNSLLSVLVGLLLLGGRRRRRAPQP
jgi:MYXO-CTERM domain-containing protein